MQLVTKFNSFTVEERPGEMLIMLRGKFGDSEDITIRASMFDGHVDVPAPGDDSSGGNVTLLHLTLAVDISKGEDGSSLKFLCSVWPECLVVHKIYISRFGKVPAKPYFGPHFRFELHFSLCLSYISILFIVSLAKSFYIYTSTMQSQKWAIRNLYHKALAVSKLFRRYANSSCLFQLLISGTWTLRFRKSFASTWTQGE